MISPGPRMRPESLIPLGDGVESQQRFPVAQQASYGVGATGRRKHTGYRTLPPA